MDLEGIVRLLEQHEDRITSLEKTLSQGVSPKTKVESINEFLKRIEPHDDNELVLAVGYFLETRENMSVYSSSDIRWALKNAKLTIPANISSCLARNITRTVMKVAQHGSGTTPATYELTNTGIELVEDRYQVGGERGQQR